MINLIINGVHYIEKKWRYLCEWRTLGRCWAIQIFIKCGRAEIGTLILLLKLFLSKWKNISI